MLLECWCLLASYGFDRVLCNSLVYGLQKTTDWPAETSQSLSTTSQSQSTTSHIFSSKRILIFCSYLNISRSRLPLRFRVPDSDCTVLKSQCVPHISPIWNSLKRKPHCINYLLAPFFLNIWTFQERTFLLLSFGFALHTTKCKLTDHTTSNSMIENPFLPKMSEGLIWPFFLTCVYY
jgi:hypothetical protein